MSEKYPVTPSFFEKQASLMHQYVTKLNEYVENDLCAVILDNERIKGRATLHDKSIHIIFSKG
jgi:hypothetical protein